MAALLDGDTRASPRPRGPFEERDVSRACLGPVEASRLELGGKPVGAFATAVGAGPALGPLVRHGDDRWFDIVKWTLFAMIEAEELGLTSKTIDQALQSKDPSVQRFVGASGDLGKMMGLDNKWAYNIVKQVGNYGESFEANLKPLGFERGVNELWTKGGLLYAPPLR